MGGLKDFILLSRNQSIDTFHALFPSPPRIQQQLISKTPSPVGGARVPNIQQAQREQDQGQGGQDQLEDYKLERPLQAKRVWG
jgi:hypothetical protein